MGLQGPAQVEAAMSDAACAVSVKDEDPFLASSGDEVLAATWSSESRGTSNVEPAPPHPANKFENMDGLKGGGWRSSARALQSGPDT